MIVSLEPKFVDDNNELGIRSLATFLRSGFCEEKLMTINNHSLEAILKIVRS